MFALLGFLIDSPYIMHSWPLEAEVALQGLFVTFSYRFFPYENEIYPY
jgi:hypothetical protein